MVYIQENKIMKFVLFNFDVLKIIRRVFNKLIQQKFKSKLEVEVDLKIQIKFEQRFTLSTLVV